MNSVFVHFLQTHKYHFLLIFSLKMSFIILFIHLKIIYYNIFQFSISHPNRRLVLPNLKTIWWIFRQDLVGPILTSLAHNTPSLFYRVYKRYFPGCSFMDAELVATLPIFGGACWQLGILSLKAPSGKQVMAGLLELSHTNGSPTNRSSWGTATWLNGEGFN